MRLRAVFVGDDNGQNRSQITPGQVEQWVDQANRIFRSSRIFFYFDPATDWENLNSTLLNHMTGDGDPNWVQEKTFANQVAAQTPDRLVVFFRWVGGGFSWSDLNFVAMPGFNSEVCGVQNIGLMGHEIGHYLGLAHTFAAEFASIAAAASYFSSHGSDPEVFNGDGRDETDTDPFVRTTQTQCVATSVTLNAVTFPLPRTNAMSYYHPISTFTTSQSWTMRQVLLLRLGLNVAGIVSNGGVGLYEGEALTRMISGGSAGPQTMTAFHGRWSGNQQVFWLDGLVGATFITQFSAPPGTRDLYASFTAAPDFGIHTIFLDGVAIGTIDLYANQVLVTGPVYLGRFNFGPGGTQFKVMVSGSNPRAISRHGFGLDYILVSQPGTTDLIDPSGVAEFLLESAEPNPFTTETVIRYWLPSRNQVSLEIFDVSGRRVSMLEHGERGAGAHAVNWNGGDDSGAALSPGVYICTLHAGPRTQHRLITLLR